MTSKNNRTTSVTISKDRVNHQELQENITVLRQRHNIDVSKKKSGNEKI